MTEAIAVLEWVGCITGIIGALLVALNNDWSKWGFIAYLVSNVCWFGFGLYHGAAGLVWMQVAFMLTTLVGIYRWVLPVSPLGGIGLALRKDVAAARGDGCAESSLLP